MIVGGSRSGICGGNRMTLVSEVYEYIEPKCY